MSDATAPSSKILHVDVVLGCEVWREHASLQDAIQTLLNVAASDEGVTGALALLLADDACLRELNHEWRGKDSPTNVLSFPAAYIPGAPAFLGDIALSAQTIAAEAADQGKKFEDHALHLAVHGFLHLIGYDHECDADAERMEARERAILAKAGIADPYKLWREQQNVGK